MKDFKFEVFYNEDAEYIISSRKKAIAVHQAGNIDAAGDEVEIPVNEIISKRIPNYYYVTQGHIVDKSLALSGQFDTLIADNKSSPILYSTANKTEFLTYESIYAVGEIKSTYYKNKNYVEAFCEKIKSVKTELSRKQTEPTQLTPDLHFSNNGIIQITSSDSRPYKNPLFKFMFFGDKGDIDLEKLKDTLAKYDYEYTPNLIVIMGLGVIVCSEVTFKQSETQQTTKTLIEKTEANPEVRHIEHTVTINYTINNLELYPEFNKKTSGTDLKWTLYEFEESNLNGSILAFLTYALNNQISNCMLLKPNLFEYHNKIFKLKKKGLI